MALDPNKKFLYFNKDATSTEMDSALCFPISRLIGIEVQTSSHLLFYFEGSKGADATTVKVFHEQYAFQKSFLSSLTDEINFGEKAFIKVYDHAERATSPSDVTINMMTDVVPTFTLQDTESNEESLVLSTALPVSSGGTNATSFADKSVLITQDSGTDTVAAAQMDGNGELLIGGTSGPAVATLTAGSNVTITNADGGITIAASSGGGSSVVSDPFSSTIIKVLPHQFAINDDVGRPLFVEDDTSNTLGIRTASSSDEMYAFVKLPDGYKATHVNVHASASPSSAVTVKSYNYKSGADNAVSSTTATPNTNTAITNIAASSTQDLVIKVAPGSASTIVFGASVTIATV